MKTGFKRVLTLALAGLMAAGMMAGCSGGGSGDSSVPDNGPGTSDQSVSMNAPDEGENFAGPSGNTPIVNGKADTSKFVTLKMLQLGDPPAGGADKRVLEEINKVLKEKLNCELEWQWIEWNNYETKYQMELVSGSAIDLIFSTSTWLDLWGNTEKGAFMDIKELIPRYAPQLYADTTEQEWEGCTYKGKVVALPEHRFRQLSTPLALYRQDWADQFGIGKIDSIEKLGQYFQGIKDNMPEVTPYNVAGGISSNEFYSMYLRQNTDYVLGPGTTGMFSAVASKSYEDCWTIACPIMDDWFVDFAKLMKDWGDKGYWPQDVMNSNADAKTTLLAGTNGMWQINVADYYGILPKMKEENPDAKLGGFFFDGPPRSLVVENVVTQDACSITANAANPERALMVYDLLQYDPDLYKLSQYGIEGEQYIIQDGKRAKPEGYTDEKDHYEWNLWSTRNDALSIPSIDDPVDEINAINEEIYPWAKANPWGSFVFDPSSVKAELQAIGQACSKWGPNINFGKAGDPETAVNQFREDLKKAGIETYMAEVQRQCDEYLASLKK